MGCNASEARFLGLRLRRPRFGLASIAADWLWFFVEPPRRALRAVPPTQRGQSQDVPRRRERITMTCLLFGALVRSAAWTQMSESEMTAGGERVLADAPSGLRVDLSDLPEEKRVVSADLIRRLCVGPEAKDVDPTRNSDQGGAYRRPPRPVVIARSRIHLRFRSDHVRRRPDLYEAHLPALWIRDCIASWTAGHGIRTGELTSTRAE